MRQRSHTSELSSEQRQRHADVSQLSVLVGHQLRRSKPLLLPGTQREGDVHGFPLSPGRALITPISPSHILLSALWATADATNPP
jgi:hypothetical protein